MATKPVLGEKKSKRCLCEGKMPVENLAEEGLPKNPNLDLANYRFILSNPDGKDKQAAKEKLLEAIKENGESCLLFSHGRQIEIETGISFWE